MKSSKKADTLLFFFIFQNVKNSKVLFFTYTQTCKRERWEKHGFQLLLNLKKNGDLVLKKNFNCFKNYILFACSYEW